MAWTECRLSIKRCHSAGQLQFRHKSLCTFYSIVQNSLAETVLKFRQDVPRNC
jgi:hypothetical protein